MNAQFEILYKKKKEYYYSNRINSIVDIITLVIFNYFKNATNCIKYNIRIYLKLFLFS